MSSSKPSTKFFVDTEFSERGRSHPITLISLGAVSEYGDEFYAVSSDFKEEDCSDWLKANVLPHLGDAKRIPLRDIAVKFFHWVELVSTQNTRPAFWGYYADYDWVVIAQMFGTMMDLPKGWPMYCRDLKQWCDQLGNPELPKQTSTEHNALADAQWNKVAYAFLDGKAQGK